MRFNYCKSCGKKFEILHEKGRNIYCSIDCRNRKIRERKKIIRGFNIRDDGVLTDEEYRRIMLLDPWTMKVDLKICSVCNSIYIPTRKGIYQCIPCHYKLTYNYGKTLDTRSCEASGSTS